VLGFTALLYRYGPSRNRAFPHRPLITVGGVLAAVGWMIMSILFSTYVAHFGAYNRTYGSLGAGVGFMTWIWLSLMVVLLGGELNAQLEKWGGSRL
jgi:membrane protein